MFPRRLNRLVVSTVLALIALAVVAVSIPPSSSAQSDSSVVFAGSGGTLISSNSQVTVTVSSGAVKQAVAVTLSAQVSPTLPTRFTVIGSAFTLATQDQTAVGLTQIVIHYTVPAGINEKDLVVVYYDAAAEKWLPLPTQVDTSKHVATASTNQGGQFALISRVAIKSLPSNAVIVDDLDAGFAKFGSMNYWYPYTVTQDTWAGHMWWTYRAQSVRSNYATWTPALNPGLYDVYAFIAAYNTNTTNARYQIVHQGSTTIYTVNQSNYFAEWVKIGTYYFGNGAGNSVQLEDLTYETALTRVGFDAIAFVPNKVYLPLVLNNYPPIKTKSGMHMGNRQSDWLPPGGPADFLYRIDGSRGGMWPKAVVVLGSPLSYLDRRTTGLCDIAKARVRAQGLYDYLTKAINNGVMIIIRIEPSPGNFADYNDPNWSNHHLFSGTTPAGGDYCTAKFQQFRAVNDVAIEINEIYKVNVNQYGWDPSRF